MKYVMHMGDFRFKVRYKFRNFFLNFFGPDCLNRSGQTPQIFIVLFIEDDIMAFGTEQFKL